MVGESPSQVFTNSEIAYLTSKIAPLRSNRRRNRFEREVFAKLPETEEEFSCHRLLSCLTVDAAMTRHTGRLEVVYSPTGEKLVQHGKDLTGIKTIIGTGGPIIFTDNHRELLEHALFREEDPFVLKPKSPEYYIDERYILYAVGLLSQVEAKKALKIAKKYLKRI